MNQKDHIINEIPTKTMIAVIGGGHAGAEAALASARLGLDTVLFTLSLDAIGNLPCNPSIGGTAKGHLVFEIDALGGEMGRVADAVTLQSRTLNLGKGAAVHSKRVQADRRAYHHLMKHTLETTENLRVVQAEITEILTQDGEVIGVVTSLGEAWSCQKVIIATGTSLGGRIFVGDKNYASGPDHSLPANQLTACLKSLGLPIMRFKTGTPARIKRESVDLSVLEVQNGEEEIIPFSSRTPEHAFDNVKQIPCHIVYTNAETHRIILENIHRSAMYSGQIHGTGPRYCPSIEDKLKRFADKERHQLFVEPVGLDNEELYLQGFSTSLPTDVQHRMIRTLKGFEHAQIMRYAYAIEYDCIDPTSLYATLECKFIKGLYGAGQFNGTSGYEEAAAQGLIAGINAALACMNREPLVLQRSSSYIGTLIDDLVTKGTNEPYRMMTSRSEFRLILRQDNADIRLTPIGYHIGLVPEDRYQRFLKKKSEEEEEKKRLTSTYFSPEKVNPLLENLGLEPVKSGISLSELLKRPQISYEDLKILDTKRPQLEKAVIKTVEVDLKYDGYIKRELAEVSKLEKLESKKIPENIDYSTIKGLRIEAGQKLGQIRPITIGQASRISGVSPADITVLLLYLGIK